MAGAHEAEALEVEHLADGHAPEGQQPLVQDEAQVGAGGADGAALEGGGVAGHGGELAVPQPAQDVLAGLDAGEVVAGPVGQGLLLGGGQGVVGASEAALKSELDSAVKPAWVFVGHQ